MRARAPRRHKQSAMKEDQLTKREKTRCSRTTRRRWRRRRAPPSSSNSSVHGVALVREVEVVGLLKVLLLAAARRRLAREVRAPVVDELRVLGRLVALRFVFVVVWLWLWFFCVWVSKVRRAARTTKTTTPQLLARPLHTHTHTPTKLLTAACLFLRASLMKKLATSWLISTASGECGMCRKRAHSKAFFSGCHCVAVMG